MNGPEPSQAELASPNNATASPDSATRIAVVTPFQGEPSETLRRCIQTVQEQNIAVALHVLVGDGTELPEDLRELPQHVHCVPLPAGCEDTGATPRAIGSIYALAHRCNALAYLDADNTWARSHLADAIRLRERGADISYSDRWICHHTSNEPLYRDREDSSKLMVDTNTIVLFGAATQLGANWWNVPRSASVRTAGVDRYFLTHILEQSERLGLRIGATRKPTVFYRSRWTNHYSGLDCDPPDPAKTLIEEDGVIRAVSVYPTRRDENGQWYYSRRSPIGHSSRTVPADRHLIVMGQPEVTTELLSRLSGRPDCCVSFEVYPDYFLNPERPPASMKEFEAQWAFDPAQHLHAVHGSTGYLLDPEAPLAAKNIFASGLRPKFLVLLPPTDNRGPQPWTCGDVLRQYVRYYPRTSFLVRFDADIDKSEFYADLEQFLSTGFADLRYSGAEIEDLSTGNRVSDPDQYVSDVELQLKWLYKNFGMDTPAWDRSRESNKALPTNSSTQ